MAESSTPVAASGVGRKHSDSHSETRQPKNREKLQNQQMSAGMSGSGLSRKRKIESTESITTVDLDTDSSGGDGSSSTSLQSAQPKISRPSTTEVESTLITMAEEAATQPQFVGLGDQHLQPVSHRYVVNISDTSLLQRVRSAPNLPGTTPKPSNSLQGGLDSAVGGEGAGGRRKSQVFKFDCKLGDMWLENIYDRSRSRHRKIVTGNINTDKVIDSLKVQGYSMYGQLAKGKFGVFVAAYSIIRRKDVALKIFDRENDVNSTVATSALCCSYDLPNEIQIYRQLKHENVVELLDYNVINNRMMSVLELCENGNLRNLVKMTPGCILAEPVCRHYFRDMFEAVSYLHSQGIVHCDIKCENFLLDRYDRIKLCDFACARRYVIGDELYTIKHGTAGYRCPEVLSGQPYNPRTADVWALGVSLHVLLTSRLPFAEDEIQSLKAMQKGLDLIKATSIKLSRDAVELLKGLLHYVLQVRFTINRVRCCDWMKRQEVPKPYIGNFYLVSKPRKFKDSPEEQILKKSFGI